MKVKALKKFTYSHITPKGRTRNAAIGQTIDDFPESLRHLIEKKYVEEIKTEADTGVSKLTPAPAPAPAPAPDIPKKKKGRPRKG